MIKDLKADSHVNIQLLVSSVSKGVTSKGAPYLNITLQDNSGTIEAKKWDVVEEDYDIIAEGKVVEFDADVLDYRGANQLRVSDARAVDQSKIDLSAYVQNAPLSKKTMQDKLGKYIDEIKDEEIHKVVDTIINECFLEFTIFPAAAKIHHAYSSGLLHHTTTMLDLANAVASIYSEIDKDYLFAGVVLHDIGKIEEFTGVVSTKYTLEGKLLGHISIGYSKVKEVCERLNISKDKRVILEHLVLAHHGEREKGSPVLPSTLEAFVLSRIDELDASINAIIKALGSINEGEFTNKVPWLEETSFYKQPK